MANTKNHWFKEVPGELFDGMEIGRKAIHFLLIQMMVIVL